MGSQARLPATGAINFGDLYSINYIYRCQVGEAAFHFKWATLTGPTPTLYSFHSCMLLLVVYVHGICEHGPTYGPYEPMALRPRVMGAGNLHDRHFDFFGGSIALRELRKGVNPGQVSSAGCRATPSISNHYQQKWIEVSQETSLQVYDLLTKYRLKWSNWWSQARVREPDNKENTCY
ncbi:hypothetical protein VNO77_19938 [Canavalia gladiata]|uniref:Uncharacterized protein n=1 Tax=Canavalia gladiata TaxID=3824 RepID=A0AAN9LP91_CANGL